MRDHARAATRRDDAAAALYFGDVMHARLKPIGHRFSYRVMSLLIDLDRLDEADRQSTLFGVNRAALYSFHESDHGDRDGSSLRAYAQRCAAEHGIDLTRRPGAAALLSRACSATPSIRCRSISAIAPTASWRCDLRSAQHLRRNPPLRAAGACRTRSAPPACGSSRTSCSTSRPSSRWRCATISASRRRQTTVKLRILETDREGPLLAATFNGSRRALTTAALLRAFVCAAAGDLQDHGGDPLGSAAALAQGRAACAAKCAAACHTRLAADKRRYIGEARPSMQGKRSGS